ncbi:MAG: LCP family protein [Chloroflexi bacterium]|nr:LCP family protein [Chloroflexota bacterium]
MTRAQKAIIAFLFIIALAFIASVGIYAFQSYRAFVTQPLGPALPSAPLSLPPTWTPTVSLVTPEPTPTHSTPIPGAEAYIPTPFSITLAPRVVCGGPDVMNIIVVGADSRSDGYLYGLGDAIRLVRVDFTTPKITVLEFPRDLWVEIPYIADNLNGQDHEKLNQAYLYGQPGFRYWDDPSGGPGLLSLTLDRNFGVHADHYVAVNMRTFVNVVNAVDGIDVTISNEKSAKLFGLQIGENHLNGDEALKVVRNRGNGTFGRADNQNIVLCGLRKKLTSPGVITKIPELIQSFQDNILTDFTPEQLSQLACLGTKMPPQNILFATFPEELFTQTHIFDPVFEKEVFTWDVDFNILADYVAQFQAGTWPQPVPAKPESTKTEIVCQ